MTEIYAYLRGNRSQSLDKHIKLCLEAFEEIKETKIWDAFRKIYNDAKVEKYVKFAIIFHDFGKIFYQTNRYSNKKENVEYLSFRGHEFFSTYLADKFLNLWLEKDISNRTDEYEDFRLLVYASILYHHHAMGLKSREKVDEIRVCRNHDEYKKILNRSGEILKYYLKNFGDNVVDLFIEELKNFRLKKSDRNEYILNRRIISDVFRYVDELNVEIWRNFVKNKIFRKMMILTTNILLTVDYKGSENRGEVRTEFSEVLNEFIWLYKFCKKFI